MVRGQQRRVETPGGEICYTLVKKRVKNLNLRVDHGGQVKLSVPRNCPLAQADGMIREKWEWIMGAQEKQCGGIRELPPEPSREECKRRLEEALNRVCPLVSGLGVARPQLKLRKMRSQWGNCHWAQGYITLNTALARCPEHLRDYVALHELLHFLHHDHGPEFRGLLDAIMPDWRARREELRSYGALLVREK